MFHDFWMNVFIRTNLIYKLVAKPFYRQFSYTSLVIQTSTLSQALANHQKSMKYNVDVDVPKQFLTDGLTE